jgi:hypothetical protein
MSFRNLPYVFWAYLELPELFDDGDDLARGGGLLEDGIAHVQNHLRHIVRIYKIINFMTDMEKINSADKLDKTKDTVAGMG